VEGQLIGGRYELQRLVGRGGAADVYRAQDSVLGRTVALKLLAAGGDAAAAERFRAEARTAARLVHANLLTVIDRGQDDGRDYVVFEYLGDETLRDRLRRQGPLPVRDVVALGIQIASALAFAEDREGVRREVQAESVLLGEAGQIKLADFGMSPGGTVDEDTLPHGDAVVDVEPPAAAQARVQDGIKSLGALLFELLTGLPAAGADDGLLLGERRPDCPERLRGAIGRALGEHAGAAAPEPFGSLKELGRELELCLDELERSERRSRVRAAATGVIAAPPAPKPVVPGPVAASVPQDVAGPPARERAVGRGRRLAPLLVPALAVAVAGGAAAFYLLGGRGKAGQSTAPPVAAVHLRAVAAYDPPPGDGQEDDARVPLATDGNPSTAWITERYATRHFGNLKSGVGLILDAGRAVELRALDVRTDTPGFTATIKAGPSPGGPFATVAGTRTVGGSTSFLLSTNSPERYYLLWITSLSPATGPRYYVDVNEVSAG
jgi:hypothetical protein